MQNEPAANDPHLVTHDMQPTDVSCSWCGWNVLTNGPLPDSCPQGSADRSSPNALYPDDTYVIEADPDADAAAFWRQDREFAIDNDLPIPRPPWAP